jgi:hypothetical protein
MTECGSRAGLNLCKSAISTGPLTASIQTATSFAVSVVWPLQLESLPFRKNERMIDEKNILDAEPRRHRHV